MSRRSTFGRRTVLKSVGLTIGGSAVAGTAGARTDNPFDTPNANFREGETVTVTGDGAEVRTFATTNRAGKPTHLGIWLDGGAFDKLTNELNAQHLHLDFPAVDGLNYTFAGIDWNPAGHPPPDVWGLPHFDFHYYLVDEAAVESIVTPGPFPFMGVATYDLPEAFWPDRYVYEEPRFIVKRMGEHLYDETSPEWDPDVDFTHTYIYGAYDFAIDPNDPDGTVDVTLAPGDDPIELPTYAGSGTGQLTFTEPMITAAFMQDVAASGEAVSTAVPVPSAFPEAGYYPTQYTTRYVGNADAYAITLEEFVWIESLDA